MKIPVELFSAVEAHLADHRLYHSEFQIDHFITARGGDQHPWGMYVQCLRELHNRRSALKDVENSFAENEISIEESRWKLSKFVWRRKAKFEKRREAVKLQKLLVAKESLEKQAKESLRETDRFLVQATRLRKVFGKEALTDERKQELDQDYWLHRLQLQVASGVLVHGVPPVDVVQMLPGLPVQVRMPLMDFLASVKTKDKALGYILSLAPESKLELQSA